MPKVQQGIKPEATVDQAIKVQVQVVVAPVSVVNLNGDPVDGLGAEQFHLFDNGKEQDVHVDMAFPPISIVIAVQANESARRGDPGGQALEAAPSTFHHRRSSGSGSRHGFYAECACPPLPELHRGEYSRYD